MVGAALLVVSTHHDAAYRPLLLSPSSRGPQEFHSPGSRNHARMPHCLRWGGMASLLGGLGDRFPQHNRELPSKSPAACGGDLYFSGLPSTDKSVVSLCYSSVLDTRGYIHQSPCNPLSAHW